MSQPASLLHALPPGPIARERALRIALTALAVALALLWGVAPGRHVPYLAFLALGSLGASLALGARAGPGLAGALALAAWADARLPDLPFAYMMRLRLEAIAAFLPLVALTLLSTTRPTRSRAARTLVAVALFLAAMGVCVRLLEAWFLTGRPGDAATLRHGLRLDLATSLWSASAWALAFTFLADVPPPSRSPSRVMRLRHGGAWASAFVGFALVASGSPAFVEAGAAPASGLLVGFHAEEVAHVPRGADIVHLEAAMPRIEREPDRFDFTTLDAQVAEAEARGLSVYLLVSTYPPRWLQQAYPESVMVDADGEPFFWIDEAPGKPLRRIWDMSYADSRVFAEKAEFVRRVVHRYGDHPAIEWVAVQNEPSYPLHWNLLRWASFDETTKAAFRTALRTELDGDLARLAEAYGIEADSWDDVEPPRTPFGRIGERWMQWREDLLVTHTTGLMHVAHAQTDKPVTTKLMAHFLTRFAEPQAGLSDATYRALARASDVVSIDLYPATRADLVRQLEYFEALAEGKPIIVAEFNLALGDALPFSGMRMLSALETLSRHADAVILFTASGHYLYGIEPDSAALEATRLARLGFFDGGYAGAFEELWKRELQDLVRFPGRAREALALVA